MMMVKSGQLWIKKHSKAAHSIMICMGPVNCFKNIFHKGSFSFQVEPDRTQDPWKTRQPIFGQRATSGRPMRLGGNPGKGERRLPVISSIRHSCSMAGRCCEDVGVPSIACPVLIHSLEDLQELNTAPVVTQEKKPFSELRRVFWEKRICHHMAPTDRLTNGRTSDRLGTSLGRSTRDFSSASTA